MFCIDVITYIMWLT